MRQPVGPCYLITLWNFPMAMAARKIAPAIAAGCTMVIKPAEQTPLSTLALADLLASCGLPPGVLNVVTTSAPAPVSAAVMADRRLRKISFTGSTRSGESSSCSNGGSRQTEQEPQESRDELTRTGRLHNVRRFSQVIEAGRHR